MIICTNCGAINSEENGKFCRKCGALLPVSRKAPRIRITSRKKEKIQTDDQKVDQLNLQEIPVEVSRVEERSPISRPKNQETALKDLQAIPQDSIKDSGPIKPPHKLEDNQSLPKEQEIFRRPDLEPIENSKKFLQEITPKPFQGSLIANKAVYGALSQKAVEKIAEKQTLHAKSTGIESKMEAPKAMTEVPSKSFQSDSSVLKRKQLEEDMTDVLSFLSKKLSLPEIEEKKSTLPKKEISKEIEKIPPSSMNDILKELLKLDLHIEASAIIKMDGTILASAISNRISDQLFATIGQNLSMIGIDIVEGLSAGTLTSISVRGTKGVLDLAPIDRKSPLVRDMILVIFSHPRVRAGIIAFAVNIVKKQIIEYLGIKK
jgi:predicted regulator of Ras-like GTPase activity (Roadblock/LC7/MglB family)